MIGECKLCFGMQELQDSHIWPKLIYRRYIADCEDGGAFLDIENGRKTNRQVTENWFCRECELVLSRSESEIAIWLDRLEREPDVSLSIDQNMLLFAVSMSYRVTLKMLPGKSGKRDQRITDALSTWRRFLLGKSQSVGVFSQHLFVVHHSLAKIHHRIGGNFLHDYPAVFSQSGPLFIVGLFEKSKAYRQENPAWSSSELTLSLRQVAPIKEWHEGRNIPSVLLRELMDHEVLLNSRTMIAGRKAFGR